VDAELNRQLNDFARTVMMPVLELVQQYCDRQGAAVWLTTGRPLGNSELGQLLAELPPSVKPRWSVAALKVQRKELDDFKARFNRDTDTFYLLVEVESCEDDSIRMVPSVFWATRHDAKFQYFAAVEGGDDPPMTTQVHLLNYFIGSIEAFEAEVLASP
jgi:hypothetical protein